MTVHMEFEPTDERDFKSELITPVVSQHISTSHFANILSHISLLPTSLVIRNLLTQCSLMSLHIGTLCYHSVDFGWGIILSTYDIYGVATDYDLSPTLEENIMTMRSHITEKIHRHTTRSQNVTQCWYKTLFWAPS